MAYSDQVIVEKLLQNVRTVGLGVRVELNKAKSGKWTSRYQGEFRQRDYDKEIAEVTSRRTRHVVEQAHKTITDWIRPGGKFDLGVKLGSKPTAADNLFVGERSEGGTTVYTLEEGDKTGANTMMRLGLTPGKYREHSTPRASTTLIKLNSPLGVILQWTRARGIKNKFLKKTKRRNHADARMRAFKKGKPLKVSRVRDVKKEQESTIVFLMWRAIKVNGTSKYYKRTFGSRTFDYVNRYVRNNLSKVMDTAGLRIADDLQSAGLMELTGSADMIGQYWNKKHTDLGMRTIRG